MEDYYYMVIETNPVTEEMEITRLMKATKERFEDYWETMDYKKFRYVKIKTTQ